MLEDKIEQPPSDKTGVKADDTQANGEVDAGAITHDQGLVENSTVSTSPPDEESHDSAEETVEEKAELTVLPGSV